MASFMDIYHDGMDFTCVGVTRQGRRCRQSFIANRDRQEANQMLDSFQQSIYDYRDFGTYPSALFSRLKSLANLTLCPRWHRFDRPGERSQADSVAIRWLREFEEKYPERRAERISPQSQRSTGSSRQQNNEKEWLSSRPASPLNSSRGTAQYRPSRGSSPQRQQNSEDIHPSRSTPPSISSRDTARSQQPRSSLPQQNMDVDSHPSRSTPPSISSQDTTQSRRTATPRPPRTPSPQRSNPAPSNTNSRPDAPLENGSLSPTVSSGSSRVPSVASPSGAAISYQVHTASPLPITVQTSTTIPQSPSNGRNCPQNHRNAVKVSLSITMSPEQPGNTTTIAQEVTNDLPSVNTAISILPTPDLNSPPTSPSSRATRTAREHQSSPNTRTSRSTSHLALQKNTHSTQSLPSPPQNPPASPSPGPPSIPYDSSPSRTTDTPSSSGIMSPFFPSPPQSPGLPSLPLPGLIRGFLRGVQWGALPAIFYVCYRILQIFLLV